MATINFNANQTAPTDEMGTTTILPDGWYSVIMKNSDLKPTTKDPQNFYLNCEFSVIEGEQNGSTLFDKLNIFNKNEVAQKIACGMLSAICHAVGKLEVADSSELHNIPLKLKVKTRDYVNDAGETRKTNDIVSYKPISFVPDQPTGNAAPNATPPSAPSSNPAPPVTTAPVQQNTATTAPAAQPWNVPPSANTNDNDNANVNNPPVPAWNQPPQQ